MQESLDALGLDWRQLVTNFLGFGVFLWLMARYAWKPMMSFMDQRREEIAGHYRKIEDERGELKKLRKEYEGHLQRIEEEATRRIQEAIRQGQDAAHQIEDQARARATAIMEKAKADTERVVEQAKLDLKNYVVEIGVEAGRKAALQVLDEQSHRRLVERFVEELSNVR
jgi:F-type H+-transporting ATPase subunit b